MGRIWRIAGVTVAVGLTVITVVLWLTRPEPYAAHDRTPTALDPEPDPGPDETPPPRFPLTEVELHGQTVQAADVDLFVGTPFDYPGVNQLRGEEAGFEYRGEEHYHPIHLTRHIIWSLKIGQVDRAETVATELVDGAEDGWLPYGFDWPLNDDEGQIMKAPWVVSGMAQGKAAGALCRLAEASGDDRWLDEARAVLDRFEDTGDRRVVRVEDGWWWIEEYPAEHPGDVLNGFLFALAGIYDCREAGMGGLEPMLRAGAATVAHHVDGWRRPGEASRYGLGYRAAYERYHRVHIDQFRWLEQVTGEVWFGEVADLLHEDA